jgi:hypothetical protein
MTNVGRTAGNSPAGAGTTSYAAQKVGVTVSGSSGRMSGVCPLPAGSPSGTDSGAVTITGSEDTATWSSTVTCPAVATNQCASVVLTYSRGAASCAMSNSMVMLTNVDTGSAVGCGNSNPATVTFTGDQTMPMP